MKPNTELDELIDIVDEHDCVIQTRWRSELNEEKYRRIVLAFLKLEDGRICFLRRTADKALYPSCLALVGGCVQAGETYDEAFKREVVEEVGIEVTDFEHKMLGIVHPSTITPGYLFKAVYEISVPTLDVVFNAADFSEYIWCHPQAFLDSVASQDLICPDLPQLVRQFYLSNEK